jgi:hypothetical protein
VKIFLVNEYDTREKFELTKDEATQLLQIDAILVCFSDTERLSENGPVSGICFHPAIDGPAVYAQYLETIREYREIYGPNGKAAPEDRNPFTGKVMTIIAPPKDGPEQN